MHWLYELLDWLMGYHRHVTDTRQGLQRLGQGQEHIETILTDIEARQDELQKLLEAERQARLERLRAEADVRTRRVRGAD